MSILHYATLVRMLSPSPIVLCSPHLLELSTRQSDNITQIDHPINMFFLQEFYDYTHITKASGTAALPQPLNLTLPDLDIYSSALADIKSRDDALVLNITATAAAYKAKRTIFPTKADKLTHALTWVTAPTMKPLLYSTSTVNFVMSLGSLIISLYLYLRSRRHGIAALVTQATNLPATTQAAIHLTPINSGNAVTPLPTQMPTEALCIRWQLIAMAVILTCAVLGVYGLLKFLFRTCRRYAPATYNASLIQSDIHLVLYDDRQSLSLHVTTIPYPLTELQCSLDAPVHPSYINTCGKAHVKVNWAPLKLSACPSKESTPKTPHCLTLPSTIRVPLLMRWTYARMFRRLHTCKIILCNANTAIALACDTHTDSQGQDSPSAQAWLNP